MEKQQIILLINRIVDQIYAVDGWLECSRCLMLNCCFYPRCCFNETEEDPFDNSSSDFSEDEESYRLDNKSNLQPIINPLFIRSYDDDCCWNCKQWQTEFDVY